MAKTRLAEPNIRNLMNGAPKLELKPPKKPVQEKKNGL